MLHTPHTLGLLTAAIAASSGRADEAAPKNAAGEVVLTFADATVGKPVPTYAAGDVTFSLASAPRRSKAQGRVMFFPHLKTDRKGILNAMAHEHAIPVKAAIKGGGSSVTLLLLRAVGS